MAKKGYSPEGVPLFITQKTSEIPSSTLVSINYADRTTWWHGSQRVTGEELALTEGLVGVFSHTPVICIWKVTEGDLYVEGHYNPASFRVKVYKDEEDITHHERGYEPGFPTATTATSFSINYDTGTITFDQPQGESVVTVDYSYADRATFRLQPPEGYLWRLVRVELQFSVGMDWTSPVEFVVGLNHPILTLGYDVDYQVIAYRGMKDILNKANLGATVRASGELTTDTYQVPFDYTTGYTILPPGTDLRANSMHYLEVRLKYKTKPFTNCEIATASFYIIVEPLEGGAQ